MSYIDKHNTALVRVKLTDIGREQLAKGQLNFTSWLAGDSEVDYNYVKGWTSFPTPPQLTPTLATGEFPFYNADGNIERNIFSKVLRPKDNQPFPTSFLLDQNSQFIHPLNSASSVQLLKGIVSNEAAPRGFFSGSTVEEGLTAVTTSRFIKESGVVDLGNFSGGTDTIPFIQGVLTLDTPLSATSVNDYIIFKYSNSTLGNNVGDTMTAATVNLTYNITEINGNEIKVDRALPTLNSFSGVSISYYTLPGGDDPLNTYYGLPSLSAYWNTGTLSFDSSCDVCVEDIPVWNMNNVWTENMAGQSNDGLINYRSHNYFGSEQYTGTKQFLGYNTVLSNTQPTNLQSLSYIDTFQKSLSIIHYTNSCISNFYGEMFHIDEDTDKLLSIDLPIMWHRRNEGTGSGTTIGMTFVSDTVLKTISDQDPSLPDVQYYDLIEASGMTIDPDVPLRVGKVFPNLKIVTIDNEELVAAMSYKSNRNYTLPDLSASLVNCVNGPCDGTINPGEKAYLTYWLTTSGSTGSTLNATLPVQRYVVLENTTNSPKDIQFRINNLDELPYMRKLESPSYDGYGFSANKFYLLAQVVDPNVNPRPLPKDWRQIDFTSTNITSGASETISPFLLQDQNPNVTGFLLDGATYSGASNFDLGIELDLPSGSDFSKMNFGDERLFYGNLRTHIGATIYKSLFTVNIDGATFGSSSNTTFEMGDDRFISEVGILDNNQNLVLVGKLSRPIRIADSSTAAIELTIDF
tara:strand:- start:972 stop:3206 length:2235 start_codon:yes stop_codon:yes gene_type:complete